MTKVGQLIHCEYYYVPVHHGDNTEKLTTTNSYIYIYDQVSITS